MAAPYKTPGVYIEEIAKFPPSIAPVETAIPAFIGYTEKAVRNGESLTNKPTRIESIAEYEEIFGGGPLQNVTVFLDNNNNFVKGEAVAKFYLYDSLRLFYANGGGKCYIISVGEYPHGRPAQESMEAGLNALAEEDEPTIILIPDAVSIAKEGLYSVQQKALTQCNDLMDRVLVCDVLRATDSRDLSDKVDAFRSGIDINFLKYGATYAPWIYANLPRQIWRKNLILKREGTNERIQLESFTTDDQIENLIRDVRLAETSGNELKEGVKNIIGAEYKTLNDTLQVALDLYRTTTTESTSDQLSSALQRFSNITLAVLKTIQSINTTAYPRDTQYKIIKSITSYLSGNLTVKESALALVAHHNQVISDSDPDINVIDPLNSNLNDVAQLLGFADGAAMLGDDSLPSVTSEYSSVTNDKERSDVARDAAYSAAQNAITMFNFIQSSINEFEKEFNNALLESFGKFKELTSKGAEALNLLPPSGAIAGVYATVDRERGVWKAPANISLNAVISPAVKISHQQQAQYNVHVDAGKSINIIRSFTGKGTLVWGARTLAGNDNEWKYINVRRFFNFAEESIKKATEQFVFEPNDANTWVRIQAMIENFLTTQWRQGALQGVKPEHAFYVAVGLGKTMTAQDIVEGKMIIEIGMAVVRPAEFIILRFSHKMAES
ncbi:MAG: phage tail protein [Candidatus Electrothrix sp. ATG2]|nr:phage tail protein [Candidatus Electrothrix sp. ATG2]